MASIDIEECIAETSSRIQVLTKNMPLINLSKQLIHNPFSKEHFPKHCRIQFDEGKLPSKFLEDEAPEEESTLESKGDISTDMCSLCKTSFTPYLHKTSDYLLNSFHLLHSIRKQINKTHSHCPKPHLKKSERKTLYLDLDETLVFCEKITPINKKETLPTFQTEDDWGMSVQVQVHLRPFVFEFLKAAVKHYDLVVFTAASFDYANSIVRFLDPRCELFSRILSRDSCSFINRVPFKDLTILPDFDPTSCIIIDNLLSNLAPQLENGICIAPFTGQDSDTELMKISEFLGQVAYAHDVRPYVINFSGIVKLYQQYLFRTT